MSKPYRSEKPSKVWMCATSSFTSPSFYNCNAHKHTPQTRVAHVSSPSSTIASTPQHSFPFSAMRAICSRSLHPRHIIVQPRTHLVQMCALSLPSCSPLGVSSSTFLAARPLTDAMRRHSSLSLLKSLECMTRDNYQVQRQLIHVHTQSICSQYDGVKTHEGHKHRLNFLRANTHKENVSIDFDTNSKLHRCKVVDSSP